MKSECFLVLVLGPMKAEELMYKQIMFGWFLHYTFVFLGPKCFHLFSHEPDFLPVSCCSNICFHYQIVCDSFFESMLL